MRRVTNTRIAAAASTLVATSLAVIALRPATAPAAKATAVPQAADVRTEIIRRTVYVVRHERLRKRPHGSNPPAAGAPPRGAAAGTAAPSAGATPAATLPTVVAGAGAAGVRTHTSTHAATPATGAPSTVAATPTSTPAAPTTTAVKTHTSGAKSSGSAAGTPARGSGATAPAGTKTTTPAVKTHTKRFEHRCRLDGVRRHDRAAHFDPQARRWRR